MSTKKEVNWIKDAHGVDIKPMLADDLRTLGKKPSWLVEGGFYAQAKFDGYRCMIQVEGRTVRAVSRNGKPIALTSRIRNTMTPMADGIYDGELCVIGEEGKGVDFGSVQSLITDVNHPDRERLLTFMIFDVVVYAECFLDRLKRMGQMTFPGDGVQVAETWWVKSEDDLPTHLKQAEADGFEGLILRNPSAPYLYKRNKDLLKLKSFYDEEFIVMDVFQGEGKNAGTAVLECWVQGDTYFTVTAPGDYANKRRIWEQRDRYFGRPLTVRYQSKSDEGIPRFPVAVAFKEDR